MASKAKTAPKQKTKIVVTVSGGVVNSVLCSDPNAEVELIDYDNAEEQNKTDEAEEQEEEARKTLTEVF